MSNPDKFAVDANDQRHEPAGSDADGYEPPRIESVTSADDLDREVLYSGNLSNPLP